MKTILLAGAMVLGAFAAQAATLDFALGGPTLNNQTSLSYSVGDVDLTVAGLRCGNFSGPNSSSCSDSLIDRYSNGIGMYRGGFDYHGIDGNWANEYLTLSFSPDITFKSVTFSYWDSNDDARFYTYNGSGWDYRGGVGSSGDSIYSYDFFGTYTGSSFAIGASGYNDEWKLRSVAVDYTPPVVPLPAAGWMLMAGIGGLAAMKRRRKAA